MKDLSNENIVHVVDGDIQYLQFKRLLEYKDRIQHCYSIKPFNFRRNTGEEIQYNTLCTTLGLDDKKIVRPHQVHGSNVELVKQDLEKIEYFDCDGLITNLKNKVLALVFADCMSLLLYDPVKNVIGDIHSGWRGTVQKIGQAAVKKMVQEYGCNPQDIICCFGPAIHKCHFQVDKDVKDIFLETFDDSIVEAGEVIDGVQKYYVDSIEANRKMLIECGLRAENIIDSGICTVCNQDLFHSYRAHKQDAGRNTAIISLL